MSGRILGMMVGLRSRWRRLSNRWLDEDDFRSMINMMHNSRIICVVCRNRKASSSLKLSLENLNVYRYVVCPFHPSTFLRAPFSI
jgi:hypothetical protein